MQQQTIILKQLSAEDLAKVTSLTDVKHPTLLLLRLCMVFTEVWPGWRTFKAQDGAAGVEEPGSVLTARRGGDGLTRLPASGAERSARRRSKGREREREELAEDRQGRVVGMGFLCGGPKGATGAAVSPEGGQLEDRKP
eukprot:756204-Hanusia_phi.AAC.6